MILNGIRGIFCPIYFLVVILAYASLPAFCQETNAGSDELIPLVNEPSRFGLLEKVDPVTLPQPAQQTSVDRSDIRTYPWETIEPLAPLPFIATLEAQPWQRPFYFDEKTFESMYQAQLDNGIKNFTTLAALLMVESHKASQRGDSDEAIRLAIESQSVAPNFPQPYWALSRAYWFENKARILRVVKMWLKGWAMGFQDFRTIVLFSSNWYFIIHISFFLMLIAIAIILLCKYYRLFAHDIGGIVSTQRSAFVSHMWAVTVIFIPVLLGLGPLLVGICWLIIMAVYFSRKEKQVIWTVFLLLLLLPLSFRTAASLVLAQQPGILSVIHRANYEDWLFDTQGRLESWLADHPQDKDARFSLALLKKKEGFYNDAARHYESLLDNDPRNPKVLNNLANVYLGKGRLKKAEETYQRAIASNGKIPSIHYNLYRTYLELYKFLEAQQEQELVIARHLDAELIDRQEQTFRHGEINRMVIDETLGLGELWDKALLFSAEREDLAGFLWSLVMRNLPLKYGMFVFIVLCFIVSFLFFQSSQRRFSVRCSKCGRPLSKLRSPHPVEIPNVCANCVTLFVDCKKVDLKTKQKREEQVVRHEKRQNLIWTMLTFGIPGGGLLWKEGPWWAAVCLFSFFLFVTKAFFWNGIFQDPMVLDAPNLYAPMVLFGLLFVAFYWLTVELSYRHRDSLPDCIEQYRALRGKELEVTGTRKDGSGRDDGGLVSSMPLIQANNR